jgi:DNA-binding transcriptional LysR family regulator
MSDSVEFRHLEYLIAIYEEKNFTKASERLYRSQPAVSQQIRALEEDVDFPFFVRGGREGISATAAGEFVYPWARDVLDQRREVFRMARAIHHGEVPPLRLGFSPFVIPRLLQTFRSSYEEMFPGCEIQLSGSDPIHTLQQLDHGALDCAMLPLPINRDLWNVFQIAESPLVVCMRTDDPLASQVQLDIREVAPRIKIFRNPELHPAAHSRLLEMFAEIDTPLSIASSAATPTDMQWMVKENYGLALIDQLSPLDYGLITRPIAGIHWTADTAFVSRRDGGHIALPFIEKFLKKGDLHHPRKKPPQSERIAAPNPNLQISHKQNIGSHRKEVLDSRKRLA